MCRKVYTMVLLFIGSFAISWYRQVTLTRDLVMKRSWLLLLPIQRAILERQFLQKFSFLSISIGEAWLLLLARETM